MNSNLKRQLEEDDLVYSQETAQPKYQDYQVYDDTKEKVKELIFFAKLAFFCVVTVLTVFVLLSAKLSPVFAFPLAMLISFGATNLVGHWVRKRQN